MKNRWYQHNCSTVRQSLRRERDSAAIFQIRFLNVFLNVPFYFVLFVDKEDCPMFRRGWLVDRRFRVSSRVWIRLASWRDRTVTSDSSRVVPSFAELARAARQHSMNISGKLIGRACNGTWKACVYTRRFWSGITGYCEWHLESRRAPRIRNIPTRNRSRPNSPLLINYPRVNHSNDPPPLPGQWGPNS